MRIINNNWSPIPWGWGCGGNCNGGNNNWLNKMFGYQMMFGMMQNMTNMMQNMFQRPTYMTYPQQYQQQGMMMYPYLSLGNTQQMTYNDYLNQQKEKYDFEQLKSGYSDFQFFNIGGEYQAKLKSDPTVRLSGATPLDLMDEIDSYIGEHPEAVKTKKSKKESSIEDDIETDKDKDTVAEDKTEVDDKKDTGDATRVVDDEGGGGVTPRKGEKPPKNWPAASTWYKSHFEDKNKSATKALALVDEISYNNYTITFASDDKKQELADAIAKYNVSMFDSDGNVIEGADFTKLNLPDSNAMKAYATVTPKAKTGANTPTKTITTSNYDPGTFYCMQRKISCNGKDKAVINVKSGASTGYDAYLNIYGGTNKGEWIFIQEYEVPSEDPYSNKKYKKTENINYRDFDAANNSIICKNKNIKYIQKGNVKYEVVRNDDGTMLVKYGDKTIKFEDFCTM